MYEGFVFIAIKKILKRFRLYYEDDDLYYIDDSCEFKLKINYDLEELFKFINIDMVKYDESVTSAVKAFKFIIENKFINNEIIKELLDENYGNNSINLLFKKYTDLSSIKEKISKYRYPLEDNIYIKIIDFHFKESKINEKYENYVNSRINEQRKHIKEKFSGLKVMEWIPGLNPGPRLNKIMNDFKDEIRKNYNFEEFVKKSSHNEIYVTFKCWYEHISVD